MGLGQVIDSRWADPIIRMYDRPKNAGQGRRDRKPQRKNAGTRRRARLEVEMCARNWRQTARFYEGAKVRGLVPNFNFFLPFSPFSLFLPFPSSLPFFSPPLFRASPLPPVSPSCVLLLRTRHTEHRPPKKPTANTLNA